MAILIIDDNSTNLLFLSKLAEALSEDPVVCIADPVQALDWCRHNSAVLVLVDYRMPGMSGTEFITQFRALPGRREIPIVMITTENERAVRQQALKAGATDFLAKPLDTVEFRLRVRNLLALSQAQFLLADRSRQLQHEVYLATTEIAARERELVLRLSRAAEYRDPETGAHIQRMALYSALIARSLGLDEKFVTMLLAAAPMHDIGKIATPDAILLKPGRLDPQEMAIMRRHAEQGATILAGSDSPLIQLAEEIAAAHHEKFDGSGYPRGLRGEAIPLSARIVAVADVFDALTSERPYKRAWTLENARIFLEENAGIHFCPRCLAAFLADWNAVLAIRASTPDPEPELSIDGELP